MTTIYMILGGVAAVLAAISGAFFKGKSSGKSDAVAAQTADALSKSEEVADHKEEVKAKVQESDNAVNSQDRASLIESLSADSVRRHP